MSTMSVAHPGDASFGNTSVAHKKSAHTTLTKSVVQTTVHNGCDVLAATSLIPDFFDTILGDRANQNMVKFSTMIVKKKIDYQNGTFFTRLRGDAEYKKDCFQRVYKPLFDFIENSVMVDQDPPATTFKNKGFEFVQYLKDAWVSYMNNNPFKNETKYSAGISSHFVAWTKVNGDHAKESDRITKEIKMKEDAIKEIDETMEASQQSKTALQNQIAELETEKEKCKINNAIAI